MSKQTTNKYTYDQKGQQSVVSSNQVTRGSGTRNGTEDVTTTNITAPRQSVSEGTDNGTTTSESGGRESSQTQQVPQNFEIKFQLLLKNRVPIDIDGIEPLSDC